MEKGDVVWGQIFNYFWMEKCDVGWGNFLEFLELFFNGEMWCGMLLEFSELFFNRERWFGIRRFSWIFRIIFQ
jgi:hypothetical protein